MGNVKQRHSEIKGSLVKCSNLLEINFNNFFTLHNINDRNDNLKVFPIKLQHSRLQEISIDLLPTSRSMMNDLTLKE